MPNGKDVKHIKDVVVTGDLEAPVYSGGSVNFHGHVKNTVIITCYK